MDTNYGNFGNRYGDRQKRNVADAAKGDDPESLLSVAASTSAMFDMEDNKEKLGQQVKNPKVSFLNGTVSKRDARDSKKFIEIALVIDKAMVR